MFLLHRYLLTASAVVAAFAGQTLPAQAAGAIDARTVIAAPHGMFSGVKYVRYEAMFEGVTSDRHPYRVPCQIIAPLHADDGSRLLLFDYLNTTGVEVGGTEIPFARYMMTDEFLFRGGASYATVRCDAIAIGVQWSDGLLDTSTEFIDSAGDEFAIAADYAKALRADPVAARLLGGIDRMAAFGYSKSGGRLRGLLRLDVGKGLFDFSLVGGWGSGFTFPTGNGIGSTSQEQPPPAEAGLEIDFHTEAEVVHPFFRAANARHIEPNYRAYEFAGCSHVRRVDVAFFGLPEPEKANPADWFGFVRALFAAGYDWCDGVEPPPSIWLGKPKDDRIVRDARGNALVTHVGGQAVDTTSYRLPEVAVGENRYIAVDFSYDDGTLVGLVRAICGGFVDLTDTFTSHSAYVKQITGHARALQELGYLLKSDADAIIREAEQSDIGR